MNKIVLESRYEDGKGPKTWLEEVSENDYLVNLRESWMPIYISHDANGINTLDFDGGPMIGVGSKLDGKVIERFICKEDGIHVLFKDV